MLVDMNLVDFQRLRCGLKLNAAPAMSPVRKAMEAGLREELLRSGLFADLEIGGTHEVDHLLVALGTFRHGVSDQQVAHAIQRAWAAVAFHHWQAHAFLIQDGHVELQAATLDRPAGHYVTLHLVAQMSEAPAEASPVANLPEQRRTSGASAGAVGLAHSA